MCQARHNQGNGLKANDQTYAFLVFLDSGAVVVVLLVAEGSGMGSTVVTLSEKGQDGMTSSLSASSSCSGV